MNEVVESSGAAGPADARVVLLVREGCHLCDDAREVVATVCGERGVAWRETDVDADPALLAQFSEYVPVLLVDGVQQAFWRIPPARLARALEPR